MILAIELTTAPIEDGSPGKGRVVYTSKIATFEWDTTALEFAKGRDNILLVDCSKGDCLLDAAVEIVD